MDKKKRLSISIASLFLLCLCLSITSFALGYAIFKVEDNSFQTGGIDIEIYGENPGEPIIDPNDDMFRRFEPGMTVVKPFHIKNNGTWAVYCKVFFDGVSGELGDVLDITISDNDGLELLSGKMSELTKEKVKALETELAVNEAKEMIITFHFPENEGNDHQGDSVEFAVSAIAVQTKNNPDKEFE